MNANQILRTVVRNQYMVSTVQLQFGGVIRNERMSRVVHPEYETMVFKWDAEADKVSGWLELDGTRSDTEAGAMLDHFELVMKWGAPE